MTVILSNVKSIGECLPAYLSVNVFSRKVLTGDTITSLTGDTTPVLRVHPSHAKVYPLAGQTGQRQCFHSCSKTLSDGPAPGIEPATSRSAVKRSTD